MSQGPVLIIFAKRPVPGAVKTRLCPPFTSVQAADFYACLLEDVLELMARVAPPLGLTLWLAIDPAEAVASPGVSVPAGFSVVGQHGPGLSERMERAIAEAAADGFGPILVRGSDSPALDGAVLAAGLAALDTADLVICPDRDGGYNLVGMRRPAPGIFDHAMSTDSVLEDTLVRADTLGLRHSLLPVGFDIDTVDDLRVLRTTPGIMGSCSRTWAYLDENGLWPRD
ncbi:MAG: glycosyltransferase [bacterium]|nr:glycosyltransferase [bacterium]MCP5069023.1 glycosyltransferase [bacterium]